MNKALLVIFFYFFAIVPLFAQTTNDVAPDSMIIKKMIFVGNEKTREIVLRREMKTKVGDRLDKQKLEEDRKRLMNLQLFNRVMFNPMQADDGVILLVIVAERWFVFPYPIFFFNEHEWKKVSYGAGLVHQNFRGMNILLDGSFWLGYNPGMSMYYSNPWIGAKNFFTKIRIFSNKVKSKSLEFERFNETHRGIDVIFGRRWGYHTYFALNAGYQQLSVPDAFKGATVSGSGIDRLPSLGFAFRYDTRDLFQYPKSGLRFDAYVTQTGFSNNINFIRYGIDARVYKPLLSGASLALRSSFDLSRGHIPVYGKTFIGYSERVRGYFNARGEGDNRAILEAELRVPILPIRYFDLGDKAYLLGPYGNNLPFGISAGLFYDAGAVWNQSEILRKSDFLKGFGAGLHLHVPYVDVLRLEYAFDEEKNGQFIFDIGVYF